MEWALFRYTVDQYWRDGYQVADLEVTDGNHHFSAVFTRGTATQRITVGTPLGEFQTLISRMRIEGLTLSDVEVTLDPNGGKRYSAVWTKDHRHRHFATGLSYSQLYSLNRTMESRGKYLVDLETNSGQGGAVQYSGLWEFAAEESEYILASDWNHFHALYHQKHYEGARLMDMEQLPDGRYLGLWQEHCGRDFLWVGTNFLGAAAPDPTDPDSILSHQYLLDYEVIEESATESNHPDDAVGSDPCGTVSEMTWPSRPMWTVMFVNDFGLTLDIDGNPAGLKLHNAGSAGPGN